jgi:uncharacterized protein YjiS (DUF1127 family)
MNASLSEKSQDDCAAVDRHGGKARRGAGSFFGGRAMLRLRRLLAGWRERIRERRRLRGLSTLDDRLLRDIGFTRSELRHRAAQPFWRAGSAQAEQSGGKIGGPTTIMCMCCRTVYRPARAGTPLPARLSLAFLTSPGRSKT